MDTNVSDVLSEADMQDETLSGGTLIPNFKQPFESTSLNHPTGIITVGDCVLILTETLLVYRTILLFGLMTNLFFVLKV